MPYETVIVERDGFVATITLNRPDMINALNPQITRAFHAALDEIGADDSIRAVIVTGAGRGFCSGADLSGRGAQAGAEAQRAQQAERMHQSLNNRGIVNLSTHLRELPQP